MSAAESLEWIDKFQVFSYLAIEVSERFQISYWDGAIVASGQELGGRTLYSEDISSGQFYGEVRVLSPFQSERGLPSLRN